MNTLHYATILGKLYVVRKMESLNLIALSRVIPVLLRDRNTAKWVPSDVESAIVETNTLRSIAPEEIPSFKKLVFGA